jgi:hypothetical protein
MKNIINAGLALVAIAVFACSTRAQCPAPCAPDCGHTHVTFKLVPEETIECVTVKVRNQPKVKERIFVQDVPCTRTVPVTVVGPTGCPFTTYKEEPYVKKITTIMLDIEKPCEEWSTRGEDRVKRCIHVSMDVDQPCGCCASGCCGGH